MYANKLILTLLIGCMVVGVTPNRALAEVTDALNFPSPHSRCMNASKGRILTSVGKFPALGHKDFEVVADTRLKTTSPGSLTEFYDPSVNIYNENCELVWRQSYPSLGEVGFEALQMPGRLMLHVSAISVFQPVDEVISDQELLSSDGETMTVEISFGSDRYDMSYVGYLGPDGDFGVVTVHNATPMRVSMDAISPAITTFVYRWRAFADPDDRTAPTGPLFVGPQRLNAKALAALKLHWDPRKHPPFPLYKFVFGMADPG